MKNLVKLGSQTAKNGFNKEKEIATKFNNWNSDYEAKQWLEIMGYTLGNIEYVRAIILSGYKSDINVQVQVKLKKAIDVENIQVKLVSNKKGYNQIDKRWLKSYKFMWDIPDDIYELLRYFTGELKPYINNGRSPKRMFIDEFTEKDQEIIINWLG